LSARDQLDAVLGHRGHARCLHNLRVDRNLDGFEHVPARQVDRRRLLEGQIDRRLVGADQRPRDAIDVTAREVMRLEVGNVEEEPRLGGSDQRPYHGRRTDFPQPHADQIAKAESHSGEPGLDPQAYGDRPNQEKYSRDNCEQW